MKAYKCFPGESPHDSGCFLVFADSATKARKLCFDAWPADFCVYIEFRALREPDMDKHHALVSPDLSACVVEGNNELPDGVVFFDEDL